MNLEICMLRVLTQKQYYDELNVVANKAELSAGAKDLITLFGVYFIRNPSARRIEYASIIKWAELSFKQDTQEMKDLHQQRALILTNVFSSDVTEEMVEDTRLQLCHLCASEDLSRIILSYRDGNLETDLLETVDELMIKYADLSRRTHLSPIRKDLAQILAEQNDDNGLTLPLEGLNKIVAPMKDGDFMGIGAQNNSGKTALAVQIAVHFAKQLPEDAKILYLNNEGIGDHIILRARQIALDLSKYGLEEAFKSGIPIEEKYQQAINGDSYKIEVIDVHGINVSQVQSLLRLHKPQVVIYDMGDAIHGFGGGGMDVDRYKQLYSWFRAQCANPDHRHIGVCLTQVSHDGHDHLYVPKHALEGSKVAKQSQLDTLVMVGVDENKPQLRYIWTPRCKRTRKGETESNSKFVCLFDEGVGKFNDQANGRLNDPTIDKIKAVQAVPTVESAPKQPTQ